MPQICVRASTAVPVGCAYKQPGGTPGGTTGGHSQRTQSWLTEQQWTAFLVGSLAREGIVGGKRVRALWTTQSARSVASTSDHVPYVQRYKDIKYISRLPRRFGQ